MLFKSAISGENSAVMPLHSVGDLILIYAFRDNDTLLPSVPSGYTVIDSLLGGQGTGAVTAYRIALGSSETTGTWTGADNLLVHIYEPQGGDLSIGASALANQSVAADSIVNYPAITMETTSGSSWVVLFNGHNQSDAANLANSIGSFPNRSYNKKTFNSVAGGHDSNAGLTSFAGVSFDIGGSIGYSIPATIEIKESAPSITVTDITDPLNSNGQTTLNGTGFQAAQGTGKVEQLQGAKTTTLVIDTWGDLQVIADALDIETTLYNYGTQELRITNDLLGSVTTAFESIPLANNDYVNITSLVTTGDRLTGVPDLAVNDQVRYQSVLYSNGSPTIYSVVVNPDSTFSVSGSTPGGNYTFEVKVWDSSDETWGSPANQTASISGGGGGGVVIPQSERSTYYAIANYLRSTGQFSSTQINDIIVEWLKSEGNLSSSFNDLFVEYWAGLGLTGAYNDKWKSWRG